MGVSPEPLSESKIRSEGSVRVSPWSGVLRRIFFFFFDGIRRGKRRAIAIMTLLTHHQSGCCLGQPPGAQTWPLLSCCSALSGYFSCLARGVPCPTSDRARFLAWLRFPPLFLLQIGCLGAPSCFRCSSLGYKWLPFLLMVVVLRESLGPLDLGARRMLAGGGCSLEKASVPSIDRGELGGWHGL